MGCARCGGPLSSQGACYKLACLPQVRGDRLGGGKGSGRGNYNLVADQRKARSRCPLCIEADCWPSICRNGPYSARLGHNMPCDCHALFRATNPHLVTQMRVKAFSQWQGAPPAL